MKLISLNTHSLIEKEWKKKCRMFSDAVSNHHADIVAMQEVNQTHDAEPFDEDKLKHTGYIPCKKEIVIRQDNYMLEFVNHWKRLNPGKECNWTWLPMKLGYSKYDEGLAIFSIHPIIEIKIGYFTAQTDYNNWRTRMILGALIDGNGEQQWFYSVHAGWWKEEKDGRAALIYACSLGIAAAAPAEHVLNRKPFDTFYIMDSEEDRST